MVFNSNFLQLPTILYKNSYEVFKKIEGVIMMICLILLILSCLELFNYLFVKNNIIPSIIFLFFIYYGCFWIFL